MRARPFRTASLTAAHSLPVALCRRSEEDRILSLLTIRPWHDGEGDAIQLEFSGGAAIRLDVARILCHAQDVGEPWPTQWQPRHDADERV